MLRGHDNASTTNGHFKLKMQRCKTCLLLSFGSVHLHLTSALWWVAFQGISSCRLTGPHGHCCPDPRTSKGSLESLGRVMEEAPALVGGHEGPRGPSTGSHGRAGSRRLMSSAVGWLLSSRNSYCHRWVLKEHWDPCGGLTQAQIHCFKAKRKPTFTWDPSLKEELNHHGNLSVGTSDPTHPYI